MGLSLEALNPSYHNFRPILKIKLNFCFYLASRGMKEENLEALCANMDIVITGLDVCKIFE